MRHRQILDVAKEHPDASIEEIASQVPSATPDLVENVFDTYGDPAADATDDVTEGDADGNAPTGPTPTPASTDQPTVHGEGSSDASSSTGSGSGTGDTDEKAADTDDAVAEGEPERYPSPDELTDRQREVLTVVLAEPEATQQEIGDQLDVTAATVSNRVNSIDGFDWSERASFVDAVFEAHPEIAETMTSESTAEAASTDESETEPATTSSSSDDEASTEAETDVETTLARLDARIAALEDSRAQPAAAGSAVFEDSALVHKVVHACMEAETISTEEELQIIKGLLE